MNYLGDPVLNGSSWRKKTYKTNAICKNEGHICNREGRRQLQLLGISVVPSAIAAAVIWPMKYEALNREVRVALSFGWPNSPIRDDPEIIAKTMPNPSVIREKMYIPTRCC